LLYVLYMKIIHDKMIVTGSSSARIKFTQLGGDLRSPAKATRSTDYVPNFTLIGHHNMCRFPNQKNTKNAKFVNLLHFGEIYTIMQDVILYKCFKFGAFQIRNEG